MSSTNGGGVNQPELPGLPLSCCGHKDSDHRAVVVSQRPPGDTYRAEACERCRCERNVTDREPTK